MKDDELIAAIRQAINDAIPAIADAVAMRLDPRHQPFQQQPAPMGSFVQRMNAAKADLARKEAKARAREAAKAAAEGQDNQPE